MGIPLDPTLKFGDDQHSLDETNSPLDLAAFQRDDADDLAGGVLVFRGILYAVPIGIVLWALILFALL